MKITKIEQQKKYKDRLNIYIDDEFAFGISYATYEKYRIKKGEEVDDDYINNLIKEEEKNKANDYALNLLTYRLRSKKEIIDKMKNKGYEEYLIENTINYLEKNKYLDDKYFVNAFINDKININKYGQRKIEAELYKKGIDRELISECINEINEEELLDNAIYLIRKRSLRYDKLNKRERNDKLMRYLSGRGYRYDIIKKAIDKLNIDISDESEGYDYNESIFD